MFLSTVALAVPLFAQCGDERAMGNLGPDAKIRVLYSITADQTCYKVAVQTGSSETIGYVTEPTHPAIVEYLKAIKEASIAAAAPRPPAPAPAATRAAAAPVPEQPAVPQYFDDFSGVDFHTGIRKSLGKLQKKATIVHFYDPSSKTANSDAEYLSYLSAQFDGKGLAIVGVPLTKSHSRLAQFCQDNEAVWPQLAGSPSLAAKYGVSKPSEVFLIDNDGAIIQSGSRSNDLEAGVQKLLKSRR